MSVTPFSPIRNNASGFIANSIDLDDTAISLDGSSNPNLFPDIADGSFWATLHANVSNPTKFEIVFALRTGTNAFTLIRNQDGTTSPTTGWPSGTVFAMYISRAKALEWESRILTHNHDGVNSVGLGVSSIVEGEVPGGLVNGSNTVYTTAGVFVSGKLRVYKNGLRLKGGGVDFTEAGSLQGFTMTSAPAGGAILLVDYDTQPSVFASGSASFTFNDIPVGVINGTNRIFTASRGYIAGTTQVMINGLIQQPSTDYAETTPASGVITFVTAPNTGDTVLMSYQTAISALGNASFLNGYNTSITGEVGKLYIPQNGFTAYTPAYAGGGLMTYTGITTNAAAYQQIGKKVEFYVSAVGTTGGTAAQSILFSLPPVAAKNVFGAFACYIVDGGNYQGGFSGLNSTSQGFINRFDGNNWSLGGTRAIYISGWYEAA